ncbi:hypothetical protein CF326_g9282 [Tilletia indica]|nr:hypothetical protein CF326_g9282 [Tilletia indica]
MLRKLLQRQDVLIDRVTALEENRSTVSQQMEELTSRMSRVELSPSADAPSTNLPSTASRPSDDARVVQTESSTSTSSRPSERGAPAVDAIPATLHGLLSKMVPSDQSRMREILGKYGSVNELDGRVAPAFTATSPPNASAPASPATTGNRSLVCKKDVLGEFDGDPDKLEHFLGRVQTIAGSNTDPCWEPAVVCTMPQCLVGDAQVWHIGLSKTEAAKLTTVDEWCRLMRRRFPVNITEQRKKAHARKWETASESAMTYYFKKVQLFRSAYGALLPEEAIAQEVLAALPASMRALIRLPQTGVTLEQVQDAFCEWEPTWREDNGVPLSKKKAEPKEESALTPAASVPSLSSTLTSPPLRPPRSEQRATVATLQPAAPPSSAPPIATESAPPAVASMSATYDPSRIIPAADGQPRMYRRPDSTKVMRLARNCGKCGGQHFDFEHDYMLRNGQLNTLSPLTDDYPEVEGAELGIHPF